MSTIYCIYFMCISYKILSTQNRQLYLHTIHKMVLSYQLITRFDLLLFTICTAEQDNNQSYQQRLFMLT